MRNKRKQKKKLYKQKQRTNKKNFKIFSFISHTERYKSRGEMTNNLLISKRYE